MPVAKRLAYAAAAACVAAPLAANAGTFTTLYTFTGKNDGGNPTGPLLYKGGELYGTTPAEGSGNGNVFKFDAATGKFSLIYRFKGGDGGANPNFGVLFYAGTFYGTTDAGGSPIGTCTISFPHGCGTIFSINAKTHAESILYSFGADSNPSQVLPGSLIYLSGALYGATSAGGVRSAGSVFSFNLANGTFTTLHSFTGLSDGAEPNLQLLYENGLLYGTTTRDACSNGGGYCGTLFAVNPATGAETVLHTFATFADGELPYSNLIYHAGTLQGDTAWGGMKPPCRYGCGVSFAIDAATGAETVLDTFKDGKARYSAQTLRGEAVYETLGGGGSGNHGRLIKVDLKSGKQKILYKFTGGADGDEPEAPLLYHDGALYGTTLGGGSPGCSGGCGTIFKYVP